MNGVRREQRAKKRNIMKETASATAQVMEEERGWM